MLKVSFPCEGSTLDQQGAHYRRIKKYLGSAAQGTGGVIASSNFIVSSGSIEGGVGKHREQRDSHGVGKKSDKFSLVTGHHKAPLCVGVDGGGLLKKFPLVTWIF